MSKGKAIVFGGSGFIGSHVSDELSRSGYEVTIFDVKESPYLRDDQKMITGDLLDEELVYNSIAGNDYVFNFAGIADIDECKRRPLDTVKYNILGNTVVLEGCRKANVKRFVFASSAYVYSDSGAFYKNSKQSCELLIETYQRTFGLNFTVLRYGSLYGTRSNESNSIYRYVKSAIMDKKIDYSGTGDERREYIHVRDASKLTVDILDDQYENEWVVLTGNESLRYIHLLEMINEMLNKEVDINMSGLESTSGTHYKITPYNFSPRLGKKLVNNPHIDLGQGLLELMEQIYKENKGEHI